MKISKEEAKRLQEPIAAKYLKQHPTQKYLTVIQPMAVVERLNDVLGVGVWQWTVEVITIPAEIGGRWIATVKGRLQIGPDIVLEQYGGSTNTDAGDALKGAATDALTKCASYLGIGFEIYSGEKDRAQGARPMGNGSNTGGPVEASEKQTAFITKLLGDREVPEAMEEKIRDKMVNGMTILEAKGTIDTLKKLALKGETMQS
jgi:hypothetical protein